MMSAILGKGKQESVSEEVAFEYRLIRWVSDPRKIWWKNSIDSKETMIMFVKTNKQTAKGAVWLEPGKPVREWKEMRLET